MASPYHVTSKRKPVPPTDVKVRGVDLAPQANRVRLPLRPARLHTLDIDPITTQYISPSTNPINQTFYHQTQTRAPSPSLQAHSPFPVTQAALPACRRFFLASANITRPKNRLTPMDAMRRRRMGRRTAHSRGGKRGCRGDDAGRNGYRSVCGDVRLLSVLASLAGWGISLSQV